MNDSDWRDPFADDEAARARAARRAERAARRRQRAEEARESLGERVREELSDERPATAPQQAVAAPPEPPPADPAPAPAAAPPPPPEGRPPTRSKVRSRRTLGLIGLGAVIVLVAGAGVVISRSGDDEAAPAAARGGKTLDVTIPEGLDRSQIADVVRKAGVKGNYEKATASAPKGFNLKRYDAEDADSLEGFLFPATYELFKRDDVDDLVAKQLDAFEQNIAEVDMANAKRNDLSVYEIVNIAAMIEREIQVPEERELASSVIFNRLAAGNPLGIDATIRFEDGNWTKPLLASRLEEATPYNTRINPGLPPGPIGNPGLASLEAAANPADTEFFYYVIKPGTCNEHVFVETEDEFLAAEAEYQAALEAEGGSPTDC